MSYANLGAPSLYELSCRYGDSRLLFRGPRRRLTGDYIAILGGTDTYGKYIARPFPALLEDRLGMKVVNFGLPNAGVDAFLNDRTVIDAARAARVAIIQITGAQNNSNRLYSVHPRRNDRFVKPSKLMCQLYREVDFTDYHFTRHLIAGVRRLAPDRYDYLREELRHAWVARMKTLVQKIGRPVMFLWFSNHAPDNPSEDHDPLFIDRSMIDQLRPLADDIIEVIDPPGAVMQDPDSIIFAEMASLAATQLLPPSAHVLAAEQLSVRLQSQVQQKRPA